MYSITVGIGSEQMLITAGWQDRRCDADPKLFVYVASVRSNVKQGEIMNTHC